MMQHMKDPDYVNPELAEVRISFFYLMVSTYKLNSC